MSGHAACELRLLADLARPRARGLPPTVGDMDRSELATLAESLRRLLAEINSGAMDASPTERARIEGAAAAVGVLAGDASPRMD